MNARARPALVVCVVGHAGPGGSTLPGRLRHELDGPRAGMSDRDIAIVEATGPRELLRVLVAAPSGAAAALLVVDASTGPGPQVRRHLGLLRLAGVHDVIVAVDDMDRAQWNEARFAPLRDAMAAAIAERGLAARAIVPVSARDGANLRARATAAWWRGPTLVEALEALPGPAGDGPLRLPVADVLRVGETAAVNGRIASGALAIGDEVLVLPSDRRTRVASFAGGTPAPASASAGDDVSVLLADPVAVERGDLLCAPGAAPKLTAVFDADLVWLGDGDLAAGRRVVVRIGARDVGARVATVHHALGEEDFERRAASAAGEGGFARVTLRCDAAVAVDDAAALPATGRFALVDGGLVVGAGLVDASGYPDQRRARPVSTNLVPVHHQIGVGERAARAGHRGAVVWLTGLSGAGKSTLALALERRLFDRGWGVYTLDGDNVRGGLNADLGFSPADRQENLRRVGEVAALFADAGLVCVTAFISPYRDERARARAAAGRHPFLEVWLRTSLDECERRDPKGFYRKARAGEIRGFTGIDSPYEPPESADFVLDTQALSVAEATDALAAFVLARCADDAAR